MKEILEYLKKQNAELVYDSKHFMHIKVSGCIDHHKAAEMACRCENYVSNVSNKAILFEATECGEESDDFRVAVKNNTGNAVQECLCIHFDGSWLNLWWYGYVRSEGQFWQGLKEGVKPEDVAEYLKKFWE